MESENLIFLSLFFSVIFALWGSTSFAPKEQPETVPQLHEGPPGYPAHFSNISFFISSLLVFLANFVLTFFLLKRWIDSGYPPFSNLYESLLFLTWALLLFYFPAVGFVLPPNISIVFGGAKLPEASFPAGESDNFPNGSKKVSALIGMLLVSASLFIYTFATWLLPSEMKEIKPLVPALKSNWLLMHVSIMLLSYSALLAGSLLSILYLAIFYSSRKKDEKFFTNSQIVGSGSEAPLPQVEFKNFGEDGETSPTEGVAPKTMLEGVRGFQRVAGYPPQDSMFFPPKAPSDPHPPTVISKMANGGIEGPRMRLLTDVDSLSYRSLAFAFPLLTLGIISGAVWANEAWGSYWSWDPKETWALITWFIFSIYLHLRIQKAWEGEKAAWVGCIGFFVVWICYLGVNLLGKGLHSYGWWN